MSGTVAALQFVLLGRRSAGDDAGGGNRGVITSIALPMPQPRPLTHVFNFHFQRLLLPLLLIILLQEKKLPISTLTYETFSKLSMYTSIPRNLHKLPRRPGAIRRPLKPTLRLEMNRALHR